MVLSQDEDEAHRDWMLGTPPLMSPAYHVRFTRLKFRTSCLEGWVDYTVEFKFCKSRLLNAWINF